MSAAVRDVSDGFAFTHHVYALPIVGLADRFPVRRIYCVGRNYVSHIREMKEADERDPPFFFQKPADSLVQDGGVISYPILTSDYQHEIELVVALGRRGRAIDVSDAADLIFGYAVGLDMTRRDRQRESRERRLPCLGKSESRSTSLPHAVQCAQCARWGTLIAAASL
jgi:fumarylpyruvate hydrolase